MSSAFLISDACAGRILHAKLVSPIELKVTEKSEWHKIFVPKCCIEFAMIIGCRRNVAVVHLPLKTFCILDLASKKSRGSFCHDNASGCAAAFISPDCTRIVMVHTPYAHCGLVEHRKIYSTSSIRVYNKTVFFFPTLVNSACFDNRYPNQFMFVVYVWSEIRTYNLDSDCMSPSTTLPIDAARIEIVKSSPSGEYVALRYWPCKYEAREYAVLAASNLHCLLLSIKDSAVEWPSSHYVRYCVFPQFSA
jgi:hypothetical protein